ncbi:MAG: hypothetical protein WDN48_06405 [Pseudolabrys sp.]
MTAAIRSSAPKLFSRVAEFAAKGMKGAKLPDQAVAQLAKLEDWLTKERDAYLANKKKRGLS